MAVLSTLAQEILARWDGRPDTKLDLVCDLSIPAAEKWPARRRLAMRKDCGNTLKRPIRLRVEFVDRKFPWFF